MARLLIDGDLIVYRAAFAGQSCTYKVLKRGVLLFSCEDMKGVNEKLKSLKVKKEDVEIEKKVNLLSPDTVRGIADQMISSIVKETGGESAVIYLSDKECHRHRIAKTKPYKGGRAQKPHYYLEVKRHLLSRYNAQITDDLEADDLLSIMQREHMDIGEPSIIVSYDKDLLQVPGHHYDFVKKVWHFVTHEEGMRKFFVQVGAGDSVDNIPGIPRVGVKFMEKLLDGLTEDEMRAKTKALYVSKEKEGKVKDGVKLMVETAALVGILPDFGLEMTEDLTWREVE